MVVFLYFENKTSYKISSLVFPLGLELYTEDVYIKEKSGLVRSEDRVEGRPIKAMGFLVCGARPLHWNCGVIVCQRREATGQAYRYQEPELSR